MRTSYLIGAAALAALSAPVAAQDTTLEDAQDTSTPSASTPQPRDEGAIIVTGRAQKLYRADEVSVGKLDVPPLESSLVITTITE